MGRAIWLTWKMHRFEVVAALALMGVIAISALVVAGHITGLGIDASCWPRDENDNYATRACDDAMQLYWGISGGEAQMVRLALAFIGPVVGLLLGVPVVARELELRTTSLAWSLEGRRSRWLLSRALPMLAGALAGFAVLAAAGSMLFDSMRSVDDWPYLHELGSSGVALVARGVMAFGIALLAGAVIGRTMPALIVAAVVVLAWGLGGLGVVQGQLSERFATWQQEDDADWRTRAPKPLAYAAGGTFDMSKPGVDGEPGARFDYDALDRLVVDTCGQAPEDDTGESPEYQTWADCADPVYSHAYSGTQWSKVVPGERWGEYVAVDIPLNLLVGGVAILLTFPVVARRRPG